MNRRAKSVLATGLLLPLCFATAVNAQENVQPIRDLRIDPLLLVSVKEYRHILETLGPQIYRGWDWRSIPILLYRPHVQDVLLNSPRRPPGYSKFSGRTVLPDRKIYARNDSTAQSLDGQNTSMDLDSMRVLVIADQYSRMREQLRDHLTRRSDTVTARWLENWSFIQSPYDEVEFMLHEGFHVHQDRLAPGKGANEQAVTRYPLLDATNNALVALEARLLRDAVLAKNAVDRRKKTEQFVAVRSLRRSSLDTASTAYENLNEYKEGTARYVQLRFLELGEKLTPIPEMYLHTGFTGYRGTLRRLLEDEMNDMVNVASFSDDRFGNKFGGGPMRFRLYSTGGAQALLLDDFAPDWKRHIFAPGVYLTDLLTTAIPLTAEQSASLAADAKAQYGYDTILVNRRALEAEGRRLIQDRVAAILNTPNTLVTISYGGAGDINGMGYTPFGVTAVDDHTAIYDLVPVAIRFTNRVVLRMKTVVPLIVDRGAKTVTFAISSDAKIFEGKGVSGVDISELTLGASPGTTIVVSGNRVRIELR